MKTRNTLFLLVIFAALFAYVGLFERNRKSTRERAEAAGRVAEVDRDKINTIAIQNPDGAIELRKGSNNEWTIEKPVKDRADSMVISQLFTTLESLRHDAKIDPENKEQLKEFGVAESNTKVRVSGDGEKGFELLIGKDAAVEGKIYVRAEGDDTVYVIGNDLKNQLTKKADDFRDRKLADLTTQQVKRVVVSTKDGEIELEKKNNHWSITKPLKARGDDQKINDLIASATAARIDQFVSDSSNLANYGLAEPRGTVSFFTEDAEKPVVLQIGTNGKDNDKEKTYAKLSTRDSVVLVPKDIEKVLENRPNDLRDRKIVRVESDIVDRITIEAPNKPTLVLARKGESWVQKDGDKDVAVNEAIPNQLLSDLQHTDVTNFVADTATDLPKYGLDQPQMKVTLSSFASDNTAETKAGDKPIVSVLFGKVEGDSGYVKVDDEPFIVAAPERLFESIPTDPLQLQDLSIYTYKSEDISTLEVTRSGQAPLSLEKDKEGQWKLAKGDGTVNQSIVSTLVNTLVDLRATRWVGATKPEHGLENPAVVVKFTATQDNKKTTGQLTIGSEIEGQDMFHAKVEGREGTFVISKPDHDSFDVALLDKPAQQKQTQAAPEMPAATATAQAEPQPAPVPAPASAPEPSAQPAAAPAPSAPADKPAEAAKPAASETAQAPAAPSEKPAAETPAPAAAQASAVSAEKPAAEKTEPAPAASAGKPEPKEAAPAPTAEAATPEASPASAQASNKAPSAPAAQQ